MNLAFFLEEPSAREMLKGLLPRILPSRVAVQYVVFEGKHDLDKNLVRRLRGWRKPDTTFIVLQDQDAADCKALKRRLLGKCEEAGKQAAVVRIVCRELESWYFGDLSAVEQGLGIDDLRRYARRSRYRVPDAIDSPASALKEITQGAYQKVGGSREIGRRMSTEQNTSHSFRVFMTAVKHLAGDADGTLQFGQ